MESLGLQTVTLSDGTTAYVQHAVKGECSGDLRILSLCCWKELTALLSCLLAPTWCSFLCL